MDYFLIYKDTYNKYITDCTKKERHTYERLK